VPRNLRSDELYRRPAGHRKLGATGGGAVLLLLNCLIWGIRWRISHLTKGRHLFRSFHATRGSGPKRSKVRGVAAPRARSGPALAADLRIGADRDETIHVVAGILLSVLSRRTSDVECRITPRMSNASASTYIRSDLSCSYGLLTTASQDDSYEVNRGAKCAKSSPEDN
jgi:hypothetical protein